MKRTQCLFYIAKLDQFGEEVETSGMGDGESQSLLEESLFKRKRSLHVKSGQKLKCVHENYNSEEENELMTQGSNFVCVLNAFFKLRFSVKVLH